jgi:putrescine transport system substrate-binding protein
MARTQTKAPAFLLLIAAALSACDGGGGGNGTESDESVVNVYNWADYIAPDTLANFEAEYGITVNYDIYDSSEVVDVKLLAGNSGYDVVVHSNVFASRLAPIGVFHPIDPSRLSHYGNLDPAVMEQIDAYPMVHGYTVPYHWGTTGYAWNADMVRDRLGDHPMDGADVIFDPAVVSKLADCGVTLLDSPMDVIPMVLAYLGLDPLSDDLESLAAAEAQLLAVRPYIRYFSNQKVISDLPNREVCVAMTWSGDFAQAATRAREAGIDIDLRYTMPKEGSGLWIDGLYIPSDAPHLDNAYLFIDYLLRADVAAAIANTVFYANANGASWPLIDPEILDDPTIFPDRDSWRRLFAVSPSPPKRERARTRAFSRAKSGIQR